MQLLHQPLTVKQLCSRTQLTLGAGSHVLWELQVYGLVQCLNARSNKSRVYWFTHLGLACRRQLLIDLGLPAVDPIVPDLPWDLLGWLSFRHRQVVLEHCGATPEQVCAIRRRARRHVAAIRMSTNNCRDVVKALEAKGIVERVHVLGKAHPRFRLTALGTNLRTWLISSRRSA